MSDNEITLEQARPGLFMFGGTLHLKTEYLTDQFEIEAYVGASGKFFWGGVDNYSDRAKLIVCEVDADVVAAALHSPAVTAVICALEKKPMSTPDIAAPVAQTLSVHTALARIAELEAERDKHRDNAERLYATLSDLSANARPALDRIAELEAERDRLRSALQALYDDNADYIKLNRLMRGDGTSAIHNQVMEQARAALAIRARPAP